MQNPDSGELVDAVERFFKDKGSPDWEKYEVGQRVKFNGWWWEIIGIDFTDGRDGRLNLKPVAKVGTGKGKFGSKHRKEKR